VTATTEETARTAAWPLVVNSVLASAFGVVAALLIDLLGRLLASELAGLDPVIFNNRVEVASGNDLVLAAGPVAALLAGGFFLAVYPGTRRHDTNRLAVLWLILHCFRQGLVPLAAAPLSADSDIARALAQLDLPSGLEVVVGAAGAAGLLLISLAAAPAFLAFGPSRREISTPAKRGAFVTRVAVLPGIAGAILAVPFFLPDAGTGLIPTLPLFGLFTIATFVAALGTRNVSIHGETTHKPSWALLATVVVTLLVFRFALARGIPIPPDPEHFFYT
jgi:hypothetical protein